VGPRSIKAHDLHNFLDQTDWREKLIRHGLKVEVYREFTFSRLYLRLYFLGMDGLIPHDRSYLFSRFEKYAPVPARWVKIFLKRVTYEFYWAEFNRPKIGFGCNVFIAARKVTLPAVGL
jgi:hypothetical protein